MNDQKLFDQLQEERTAAFERMNAALGKYTDQAQKVRSVMSDADAFKREMEVLKALRAEYRTAADEHDAIVQKIYKFYI